MTGSFLDIIDEIMSARHKSNALALELGLFYHVYAKAFTKNLIKNGYATFTC